MRAQAQPSTLLLTRFTMAAQVKPYKDRSLRHLPSACPVNALFPQVTTLLCAVPVLGSNTS
jgi:hypothetical protein